MLFLLLAEIEGQTPWYERLLEKHGISGLLSIVVIMLIWKYAPKLIDDIRDLIKHTKDAADKNTKVNETLGTCAATMVKSAEDFTTATLELKDLNKKQIERSIDPKHPHSTVGTNIAIAHLIEAMRVLSAQHPQFENASPHIQAALEELRNSPHFPQDSKRKSA